MFKSKDPELVAMGLAEPDFEVAVEVDDPIDLKASFLRANEINATLELTAKSDLAYGVPFLDKALGSIVPSDLIVIGGKPKQGKTQLAVEIAKVNAMRRKRVVFVALEAERNEVEMRLKYELLASYFFQSLAANQERAFVEVSYRRWRQGHLQQVMAPFESKAMELFVERYTTLDTVYRRRDFGMEELRELLRRLQDEAQMIIIDHFHYFDLGENRKTDTYTEQGKMMKTIRDLALIHNVPIILLAHLRKEARSMAPSVEDFMGTSDIGKIATQTVMLARNNDFFDPENKRFQTVISVPASRLGSINVVGIQEFDLKYQCYSPGFELARVKGMHDKETLEMVAKEKWPTWAKDKQVNFYETKL